MEKQGRFFLSIFPGARG